MILKNRKQLLSIEAAGKKIEAIVDAEHGTIPGLVPSLSEWILVEKHYNKHHLLARNFARIVANWTQPDL